MNINAEITSNRELKVYIDLEEENTDTSSSDPNAWVQNIEIFNTHSYLDGVEIYSKTYKDYSVQGDTNPEFVNPFVITDHDLNIFEATLHTDSCYPTDMFNDIIIVNVNINYKDTYQMTHDCGCNNKYLRSIVLYYPCPIYDRTMAQMNGCNCKDICEDNLPYDFMYALLKKKAIDACIGSMHIEQACRYYIKFFKQDSCNCVKLQCGCGNSESPIAKKVKTTSNCGCHG